MQEVGNDGVGDPYTFFDLLLQVKELEASDIELERQINEWKLKCELLERKFAEMRELDDKKHFEEMKAEKRPGIWLKVIGKPV